jgi:hypothetical protein
MPIPHRLHSIQFIAGSSHRFGYPPNVLAGHPRAAVSFSKPLRRPTKRLAEAICGAIAEIQSDRGVVNAQMNPLQLRGASSPIRLQPMQMIRNRNSIPCRALQQMMEE